MNTDSQNLNLNLLGWGLNHDHAGFIPPIDIGLFAQVVQTSNSLKSKRSSPFNERLKRAKMLWIISEIEAGACVSMGRIFFDL